MIDFATVRSIALALPEVEERSHHGTPDFRVRKKIFATLRPEEGRAVLKLPVDLHASLLEGNPEAFFLNGWSKQGWIELDLDHLGEAELEALAELAWMHVAPKSLVKSWKEI